MPLSGFAPLHSWTHDTGAARSPGHTGAVHVIRITVKGGFLYLPTEVVPPTTPNCGHSHGW